MMEARSKNLYQAAPDALKFEQDFKIFLKNYTKINLYDPVIKEQFNRRDIVYSNKLNHVFFQTSCPFDYVSVTLYDTKQKLIGVFEEQLFKLPQNELILGYIYKVKGGKIKYKFHREGDEIQDFEEDDEIIGIMKLLVDNIGFNDKLMNKYTWI